MSKKLLVGFSRTDISPEESIPLGGYGNAARRMSQSNPDPLYANCLAFTDEDNNTALVIVMDLVNMTNLVSPMRVDISEATGLPVEKIMLCCTHTHSAPALAEGIHDSIPRYIEKLHRCLIEVALAALEDRKEATLSVASIQTQGMNFVRRYILEDGTYAGDNYGHPDISPIACHETDADPQLQVVKFSRQVGKDIVMANFQGHPHRTGGTDRYVCSSDLVGIFRKQLEEDWDCHTLYFTGASGNVNCNSRIPEENITPDYIAHGKALAAYAAEALKELRPVRAGNVRTLCLSYTGDANHSEDYKLEQAKIVAERWQRGDGYKASIAGFEDLFNSPYHAIKIIGKAAYPATLTAQLNAISFGDVSMVFAPFELFDGLGRIIKDGTPFATTFVCCYANAAFSYMPTKLGFSHGGYGPDSCRFAPGTGEILAEKFLEMLNQLKQNEEESLA